MKKTILFIALAALFSASALSETAYATSISVSTEVMSVRNITVYMIQSHSSAKKSATYDSERNTITVDGDTYTVRDNPDYGCGGRTGQYAYVAGGKYYFNL